MSSRPSRSGAGNGRAGRLGGRLRQRTAGATTSAFAEFCHRVVGAGLHLVVDNQRAGAAGTPRPRARPCSSRTGRNWPRSSAAAGQRPRRGRGRARTAVMGGDACWPAWVRWLGCVDGTASSRATQRSPNRAVRSVPATRSSPGLLAVTAPARRPARTNTKPHKRKLESAPRGARLGCGRRQPAGKSHARPADLRRDRVRIHSQPDEVRPLRQRAEPDTLAGARKPLLATTPPGTRTAKEPSNGHPLHTTVPGRGSKPPSSASAATSPAWSCPTSAPSSPGV